MSQQYEERMQRARRKKIATFNDLRSVHLEKVTDTNTSSSQKQDDVASTKREMVYSQSGLSSPRSFRTSSSSRQGLGSASKKSSDRGLSTTYLDDQIAKNNLKHVPSSRGGLSSPRIPPTQTRHISDVPNENSKNTKKTVDNSDLSTTNQISLELPLRTRNEDNISGNETINQSENTNSQEIYDNENEPATETTEDIKKEDPDMYLLRISLVRPRFMPARRHNTVPT